MSQHAVFAAELTHLRSQGFRIIKEQARTVAIRQTSGKQRCAVVTAAVDAYRRKLATLPEDTRSARRGLLKAVALSYGVRASAICTRIKREPEP